MNPIERRQSLRIIRQARGIERKLMDLVSLMQDAMHEQDSHMEWPSVLSEVKMIQSSFPVLVDLVANIERAMHPHIRS